MWDPAAARELAPRLRPLFAAGLGWRYRRWQTELERFEEALEGWTMDGVVA
jgi:hypothetical protein